jgi:hypothetical protein
MSVTLTPNYSLLKPDIGSEVDTWGPFPNTNMDIIDTELKSISDTVSTSAPGGINLESSLITDGVTDNSATIQAAINAITSSGGGVLYLGRGNIAIAVQLNVTGPIHILGAGFGDDSNPSAQPTEPVTSLIWTGSNTSTESMILVKSATTQNYIWDFYIDGLALKGASRVAYGMTLSSTRMAHIGHLWVERCRITHVLFDDNNGASTISVNNHCDFLVMNSGSSGATANSHGLVLRTAVTGSSAFSCTKIIAAMLNGHGVILGDIDDCWFGKIKASNDPGTGYGLYFRGLTDGQARESRKNVVDFFSGGGIYAEVGSRNVVQWINSEGTKVTLEAGAVLHYNVIDRVNGRRWKSFAYDTDAQVDLLISDGYLVNGTPAFVNVGTRAGRGVAFDPATTENWQWLVPASRCFSDGRIIGVTGWGVKPSNANTGNIRLQLDVATTGDTQGFATTFTTQNITLTVDPAGSGTLEPFTITFATPVAFAANKHAIVRFSRLGGDALDTYVDDWALLNLKLIFQADVANSDLSGNYRYMPSADTN